MKRTCVVITISLLISLPSFSCDICGCGVGNFNPHLFPHLSRNFISLGYAHREYRTHFIETGVEINNHEYYNTFSLTGQYSPAKNLQLMVVLPFQVNRQTGPEGEKKLSR